MLKDILAGVTVLACLVSPAFAADLDTIGGLAPPRVIEGFGPPPRFARRPPSPCRVIATPQFNLSQDDIAGTQPQVVCLSRGIYSDTFNR